MTVLKTDSPDSRPTSLLGMTGVVACILIVASLVQVLWHLQDSSIHNANTGSRYATIESLVDEGTYVIDNSVFSNTIDRVEIEGHSYSSKPPLLPTLTAGVYWVYQQLTGHKIADHEGEVVWLCSLATGWLFHLIFLVFFYRLARLFFEKPVAILGSVACAGFANLGAAYGSHLNNHSIAASIATAGFYYAYRARTEPDSKPWFWVAAGLWLGFLPALDIPATAISGLVGLYLFTGNKRKALLYFGPALMFGVSLHLIVTYISSGSLIPIYARRDLYDYPGSYWNNEGGIDALREPKHIYAFHALLGHHGLFSMTPVFAFAAFELVRTLRKKLPYAAEALFTVAASGVLILFYIFYSHNYGGWCVGMRWFVPFMPFLLLFTGLWLERTQLKNWTLMLFLGAFAVSQFNVQDALTSPFQFSRWHNWLEGQPNRHRVGDKMNLGEEGRRKKKQIERRNKKRDRDRLWAEPEE